MFENICIYIWLNFWILFISTSDKKEKFISILYAYILPYLQVLHIDEISQLLGKLIVHSPLKQSQR